MRSPSSHAVPLRIPFFLSRIKSDIFSSLNAHYGHMAGGSRADDVDMDDEEDAIEAQAEAKGAGSASAGAKGSSSSEVKAGGQAK